MPEDIPGAFAPDSPVLPSKASLAAAALEAWFVAHLHNSAISLHTQIFNEAHAAKEQLRGFLHHLDAE